MEEGTAEYRDIAERTVGAALRGRLWFDDCVRKSEVVHFVNPCAQPGAATEGRPYSTFRDIRLFDDFELERQFFATKNRRQIELPKLSCEAQRGKTLIEINNEFQT
jgi:hypothetical protein